MLPSESGSGKDTEAVRSSTTIDDLLLEVVECLLECFYLHVLTSWRPRRSTTPDGHVAFLLRQAHSALRAVIDRELAPLGLTGPQYSALNVIARLPGLSGTELARASMLTQQTTNEILLALARQRWIRRQPRAGDRRVLEVHATEEGRHLIGQARRIVYRIERRMVADLDARDRARLRDWLVRCALELAR